MYFRSWLRRLTSRPLPTKAARVRPSGHRALSRRRLLELEILERRDLLATYSNFNGITIPATGTGPGASNPLYSQLSVSGLPSTIDYMQVELVGLSHTFPDDMDVYFGTPT